jgi:excisionase family DNA binding protein
MKKDKTIQEKPARGRLFVKEAAEYVGLGKTTFYDCLKTGEIPYYHPPRGKIQVEISALDAWLHKYKVQAGLAPVKI